MARESMPSWADAAGATVVFSIWLNLGASQLRFFDAIKTADLGQLVLRFIAGELGAGPLVRLAEALGLYPALALAGGVIGLAAGVAMALLLRRLLPDGLDRPRIWPLALSGGLGGVFGLAGLGFLYILAGTELGRNAPGFMVGGLGALIAMVPRANLERILGGYGAPPSKRAQIIALALAFGSALIGYAAGIAIGALATSALVGGMAGWWVRRR